MKNKLIAFVFVLATLATLCSVNVEAKSRTRVGFSFGRTFRSPPPVYVAPQPVYIAPQPTYVYQMCPNCRPVVVRPAPAPVVYPQPVYVQPTPIPTHRSSGFSFSFGSFFR